MCVGTVRLLSGLLSGAVWWVDIYNFLNEQRCTAHAAALQIIFYYHSFLNGTFTTIC